MTGTPHGWYVMRTSQNPDIFPDPKTGWLAPSSTVGYKEIHPIIEVVVEMAGLLEQRIRLPLFCHTACWMDDFYVYPLEQLH